MFDTLREDLRAHHGDFTRPGFHALTIHRLGNWNKSLPTKALRAPLAVVTRTLHVLARNFYGIELPFSAKIGRRVTFEHQGGIVIHGNASIGDDCVIRQGVTLGIKSMNDLVSAPVLGNGVSVGAGAVILGGVKVGDNAQIGANAVVTKDVPAGMTAVGVPAVNR